MAELLGDLFPYALDEKDEAGKVETLEQLSRFVASAFADPAKHQTQTQKARGNGPFEECA